MTCYPVPNERLAGNLPVEMMMNSISEIYGKSLVNPMPMMPGFAAAPLIGFGVMAQYWGGILGLMQGAAASAMYFTQASQELKGPLLFWNADDEEPAAFDPMSLANPMRFFAAATKTVYADMEHAGKDVIELGGAVVSGIADDSEELVRTIDSTVSLTIPARQKAQDNEDSSQPAALQQPVLIARPEQPDDLKLISGIGPKLEERLNELGIWTYSQIADWNTDQVNWMDDSLSFKGRIDRDNWIAQAAQLAGNKTN